MSIKWVVADCETDGLLYAVTKVWCICLLDWEGREYSYRPDEIGRALAHIDLYDTVIFHNAFGFDVPMLKKVYGYTPAAHIEDTFVMSSLFTPDRVGHGIASYGEEYGIPKPVHEDWSRFSEEMLHRCMEDVRIGCKAYIALSKLRVQGDWEAALALEYAMAEVASTQEMNGIKVDIPLMQRLVKEIDGKVSRIEEKVLNEVDLLVTKRWAEVKAPYLARKGIVKAAIQKWFLGDSVALQTEFCRDYQEHYRELASKSLIGGRFNKVMFDQMNLNSQPQIKEYLLAHGWLPTQWNYAKEKSGWFVKDKAGNKIATSPKITEDSFHTIEGEVPRMVCERAVLKHRRGMLLNEARGTGWLNAVRDDGRIGAAMVAQGTPTGRCRHRVVVNVPKARAKILYGRELRSVFIAESGYVYMGSDAANLEARIMGHYTFPYDGGAFMRELMEGDMHTKNSLAFTEAAGMEVSRDRSKNVFFGSIYGAQPAKIAETIGCSFQKGKVIFDTFWRVNPALASLKRDVIGALSKRKYVRGLDGRKLFCRSEHGALNYLFQSAGSIVVKTATCYINNRLNNAGFDWRQVSHFHDELSIECLPEDAAAIQVIVDKSWADAGNYWQLNIPIEGDTQVGMNWAEVH